MTTVLPVEESVGRGLLGVLESLDEQPPEWFSAVLAAIWMQQHFGEDLGADKSLEQ
jgi:hypothetical protein